MIAWGFVVVVAIVLAGFLAHFIFDLWCIEAGADWYLEHPHSPDWATIYNQKIKPWYVRRADRLEAARRREQ